MKQILITLFIIFSSTLGWCAKSYNLTISVFSSGEKTPVSGLRIVCTQSKKYTGEGITDENGSVTFYDIKEKHLNFTIYDDTDLYLEKTLFYYNPNKENDSERLFLSYNPEKEKELFANIDSKYDATTQVSLEQNSEGEILNCYVKSEDISCATYPGGKNELFKDVANFLTYPAECRDNNIQGTVEISFLIQTDGTITYVVVEKGVEEAIDQEAIRAIRSLKNWQPAIIDGHPVVAKVYVPISFQLL
ncbi:MAG: hypothetical protein CL843_19500 [Crocinitomicaceae bacterium]|nr:hypothetical protein [Crocinitomicaceae bacterium]|tara:strand:- start:403 stop:1143 length:741 start_codon:yes stop_codon:yes gene_type:complete